MKKLLLMLFGLLMAHRAVAAVGDEISYEYGGQTLKYTILSEDAKTVEVKAGKYIGVPGAGTATDDDYEAGNNVTGALVIPHKVENDGTEYTVTAIGERAFFMNSGLRSVTIPASVTSIQFSAFYKCTKLESVTIPNSVTSIGATAFSTCESLTTVTIPASVTKIDAYAFTHCTALETITSLPVVAPTSNSAFEGLYNQASLIVPQKGVDSYIYSEGDWSQFVNISTEEKKYDILTDTNGLRYRVVSDNSAVLITGNYKGLAEVNIQGTLEDDGKHYSVTTISSNVFKDCGKLTSVKIPSTVTSIGNYAFNGCDSLTSISIPNSVTSLGTCAFMRCETLKSVTSLGSITSIGDNTFARCYKLTSLKIPESVTSIAGSAFALCGALTSVEIPGSVTSIATAAFSDCTGLKSLTILGSATNIETAAFKGCINLTDIILTAVNPPSVAVGAFSSIEPYSPLHIYKNATVTVPNGCLGNYLSSNWSQFSNIKTESGDTPGETFTKEEFEYQVVGEKSVMLVRVDHSGMSTVTIPKEVVNDGKTYSITTIGKEAFKNAGITSVVLPSSLTYIGESAFLQCSRLESVTIPENVTGIGNYAFNECDDLISVSIPASVTYIGSDVFENCTSLRLLDMYGTTISDFSSVAGKLPENTLIFVPEGTAGTAGRANVVVGDTCKNFVINYGETANNQLLLSVPHPFTAENVTINRSFTEGRPGTLYLPFELKAANYGTFYTGGTYDAAKGMVCFSEVKDTYTTPNTPYMFIPNQDFTSITLENVAVSETPEDKGKDGFNGVYKMKEFTTSEVASKLYYGWANGEFCWADTGAEIDACRAYFKLPASTAANAPSRIKASFGDPGTSGISDINIEAEDDDEAAYNVFGQRVSSNYRGIVIKKGRKTINFER